MDLPERKIRKAIADGRAGQLVLSPKKLWLRISENCNLKCVGCWTPDKFFREYATVDDVKAMLTSEIDVDEISFTTNEAMLNPNFPEIIQLCRNIHPNARLWVVTNAMVAISGRFAEAISMLDKVSLSIDGSTKETFESIRVGSNFDRFIRNTTKIVDIANKTGRPNEITFGFTATATNLHQLSDVIRLARRLQVSNVWAQPMEIKSDDIEIAISDIHIDNLDPTERRRIVDEAIRTANDEDIPFYFSEGLHPTDGTSVRLPDPKSDAIGPDDKFDYTFVRKCQYPWREPVQLVKWEHGNVARPCCYILPTDRENRILAHDFGLLFELTDSASEIYNSDAMWDFREAMIDGRAIALCGKCDAARSYQP